MSDSGPQFHTWPPSLGRWPADRPIFHLVLNWARNLYPYFANTEREREEGGRAGGRRGATLARSERTAARQAMGDAVMRVGNFGSGSGTATAPITLAPSAPPSVRPSRPSVSPSDISFVRSLFPPSLSPPSQSTLCQLPRVLQRAQILLGFPMLGIPYASLINRDLISSMQSK